MERPRKGIAVVLGALILASSSLSGALLATSTASASAPQRSKPVVSRSAVRARMREDLRRVRPDGHGGLRPLGGRSGTAAPGHDSRIATNRVRGNVASLRNSSDQTVPTANWSGVLQTTSTKSMLFVLVVWRTPDQLAVGTVWSELFRSDATFPRTRFVAILESWPGAAVPDRPPSGRSPPWPSGRTRRRSSLILARTAERETTGFDLCGAEAEAVDVANNAPDSELLAKMSAPSTTAMPLRGRSMVPLP